MAGTTTIHLVPRGLKPEVRQRALKTLWIVAAIALALFLAATIILLVHWPFSQANVRTSLGEGFEGKVTFMSYRQVYWPHPGLIAEGVVLRRSDDPTIPPLATAERLVVTDRWSTVLTLQHRLRLIKLEGVKVVIPAAGTAARAADFPQNTPEFTGPETFLEMVKLEQSSLEIDDDSGNFMLPVTNLTMEDVYQGRASNFQVDVKLQQPAAAIHAEGRIGPIHSKHLGDMPMAVDFGVKGLQLADIGTLDGTLTAQGKLTGMLGAIHVDGQTQTVGFAVDGGRPVEVLASVAAVVNGLNGDTQLNSVDGKTGQTQVHASGSVAGSPKLTKLELAVEKGRVEDLMQPFVAGRPPIAGPLQLSSHAIIAPSQDGLAFLDRLSVDAKLNLPGERYTTASTEESLSAFSRRARGTNPNSPKAKPVPPQPGEPDVVMSVTALISVRKGVAQTTDLAFLIPGAELHMTGSFNFKTSTAALTGNLQMKPDISHLTTGLKAELLKPLAPLFRRGTKQGAETVVPIKITGTKSYSISGNFFAGK